MDRRAFLATSVSVVAYLRAGMPGAVQLRIATHLPGATDDLARGVGFGFAEAERSAALFGWRVARLEIPTHTGTGSADPCDTCLDAGAVLLSAAAPPMTAPVVLRLGCPEAHVAGEFTLAPCETTVAAWHSALERFGAGQLNARYRAATGTGMSGDAWLGWFAVKLVLDSALRSQRTDGAAIRDHLLSADTRFDGHKGVPLRFDAGRRLLHPLYDASGQEIRP